MIEQDHLQVYTLTLTTRGLMHIGNGQKTPRKEYVFDSRKGTVAFLDEQAFFDLLIQRDLVDLFEGFCLRNGGDLYYFLCKECGLTMVQIAPAVRYEVRVSDALDQNHSLKDIHRFMRDAQGRAYVPGSSVKGALRTALLYQRISWEDPQHHALIKDKIPEERYFHTLGVDQRHPWDAVNSLLRGVQISDSEPISDRAMTLAIKQDGLVDGGVHSINLCRECVAPGTSIRLRLTLDQSILKERITAQSILESISALSQYAAQTYGSHFAKPDGYVTPHEQNTLYLGGGAGFFSKSLVYPYLGEARGLAFASDYLNQKFSNHHRDRDRALGISPRTLKVGKYRQKLYAFGACEVTIQ